MSVFIMIVVVIFLKALIDLHYRLLFHERFRALDSASPCCFCSSLQFTAHFIFCCKQKSWNGPTQRLTETQVSSPEIRSDAAHTWSIFNYFFCDVSKSPGNNVAMTTLKLLATERVLLEQRHEQSWKWFTPCPLWVIIEGKCWTCWMQVYTQTQSTAHAYSWLTVHVPEFMSAMPRLRFVLSPET